MIPVVVGSSPISHPILLLVSNSYSAQNKSLLNICGPWTTFGPFFSCKLQNWTTLILKGILKTVSGGDNYILKGKIPVLCPDLMTWAKWMETADRHVKKEYVGNYWISTVFLGLDHGWHSENPILFETMVFNEGVTEPNMFMSCEIHPTLDEYTERYSTWNEAEEGHNRIVRIVRKSTLIVIDGTRQ